MTSREEVWDELRDEMVNDTTYTGEAAHWKYVSVTERLARREAEARVKELEEMHRRVMEEHCPTDEVHCTCVPILREQVKDLEDRLILIVDALNDLNRVLMSGRKI